MLGLKRLAAAGVLFAAATGWTLVAHAAADLYSVRAVPVDATAASAIEARDIAIANGRAEAWTRMFRRLAIEADWGKQPQLDPVRLAAMVQGFSVSNERRSSTRYLADINYTLNKDEVARAMRESGAVFTEARAQPVLILPVYDGGAGNVLWGDINPWNQAWAVAGLGGELVPLLAPSGDVEDIGLVTTEAALGGDWAALTPIADKYGVTKIIVARAAKSATGVSVDLFSVTQAGRTQETLQVPAAADEAATLMAAIAAINRHIQEDWKSKAGTQAGVGGNLVATVSYASLAEWAAVRRALGQSPLIKQVTILGMSPSGAMVQLTHEGTPEQLGSTLAEAGLSLTPGFEGAPWTIGKAAMPAAPEAPTPPAPPADGSVPL